MYKCLFSAAYKLGVPNARKLAAYSVWLAATSSQLETPKSLRRNVMGLSFPSPLGLAAGFDKHGTLFSCLAPLGFGFVEIGSVIPLPEQQRSKGLDRVVLNLSKNIRPHSIPLGVSISMNRTTRPEKMVNDYMICMEKLWEFADYITLNLGVRAGPDLHQPEYRATLYTVLAAAKDKQVLMEAESGRVCPIVVKIDQNRGDTNNLLSCVRDYAFNGLILSGDEHIHGKKEVLANLQRALNKMRDSMPVISVGGIRTPQDVLDRLSTGASLVQIYSGLVESGPLLPRRINAYLSNFGAVNKI
jgi:dihydroorotate dehydrogenase